MYQTLAFILATDMLIQLYSLRGPLVRASVNQTCNQIWVYCD